MTETEKVELAIKHLNGHSVEANTVFMLKCIASSLAKIADNMEESKKNGDYDKGFDDGLEQGLKIGEPCWDCVSRQDAVNACRNGWGYDDETIEHIVVNLLRLPSVTPKKEVENDT